MLSKLLIILWTLYEWTLPCPTADLSGPETELSALVKANPQGLIAGVTDAAAAIGRLDQALMSTPLGTALLYRMRLEAVRLQADVDGTMIDQWHLAATLEGLRPRMGSAHRIIDRGDIFDAARHALQLHQWMTEPDFDQEGEIQRAEQHLKSIELPPLLAAAHGIWSWIEGGGTRPPIRSAVVRHLVKQRLFHLPVPLTGAKALRPHASWKRSRLFQLS